MEKEWRETHLPLVIIYRGLCVPGMEPGAINTTVEKTPGVSLYGSRPYPLSRFLGWQKRLREGRVLEITQQQWK